ncbi:MAG: MFS transporter [bacterium]|nr:MFS transporter [bacterium]
MREQHSQHPQENPSPLFARCFYGYAVSGMMVLVFGSILPSIMKEGDFGYLLAGGLLSAMAIGNLSASLLFPILERFLQKRGAITLVAGLMTGMLLVITLLPPLPILYAAMVVVGIGKGSITIFNNAIVNDHSQTPAKTLNYLHCSYAVGALSSPFLTGLLSMFGCGWRVILYLLVVLGISSCLFYGSISYPQTKVSQASSSKGTRDFYKSFDFYCISFLLFFYVGLENCVNGWFVTYLQSVGIMSEAFASVMVSVTWLCIMFGRLTCAALSKSIAKSRIVLFNCLGSLVGLLLLITGSKMLQVGAGLVILGFCMSGIFPTNIAIAKPFLKGSTVGMAMLTAISSLGGILAPQLVGIVADFSGIAAAIGLLVINCAIMLLLSFCLRKREAKFL